jgi:uncharacterized damage-inducible protein DinB
VVNDIAYLFAYNEWANRRTFDAAAALTPAQRTQHIESSFPSVNATLAHIVGAEWIWLERWVGRPTAGFPDWVATPDFDDLRRRLAAVEAERRAFIAVLTEERLRADLSSRLLNGTTSSDPLHLLLRHVANHSTYHRGQVATFLRQLGVTPPSTDLIRYVREEKGQRQ